MKTHFGALYFAILPFVLSQGEILEQFLKAFIQRLILKTRNIDKSTFIEGLEHLVEVIEVILIDIDELLDILLYLLQPHLAIAIGDLLCLLEEPQLLLLGIVHLLLKTLLLLVLLLLLPLLAQLLPQGLVHLLRLLLIGVALLGLYHLVIVEIYSIR